MEEREYTLRLTLRELCTVRFELELLAEKHEQAAARAAADDMMGFGNLESVAFWREQTEICRAVAKKAQAVVEAGPSGEAK